MNTSANIVYGANNEKPNTVVLSVAIVSVFGVGANLIYKNSTKEKDNNITKLKSPTQHFLLKYKKSTTTLIKSILNLLLKCKQIKNNSHTVLIINI